jgi:tetratricopeptide (TPR) repeat protein
MTSSDANRGNRRLVVAALALITLLVAWLWYRARHPAILPPPPPDMPAVLRANNLGVGAMEQFRFKDAAEAFEKVVAEGPDWLPGHINRGIALLNQGGSEGAESEATRQARAIFEDVLRRDPNNPHAHYCLGIILTYQNQLSEALPHFEAVTKVDPDDGHAWFRLGDAYRSLSKDAEAKASFRKAVERDPYLSAAIYGLGMYLRENDPKKAAELLEQSTALRKAEWDTPSRIRYTEMGKYADVIGRVLVESPSVGPLPLFARDERFAVKLAAGTRWALAADFGELRTRVRERFGATMVVFDYDRDGKPDLFLVGAVVRGGKVGDLLLRNEGDGTFTDVTEKAGLAAPRESLGCVVADFDNDGQADLFLTGIGRQYLFRNAGGRFEDVTAKAGLDKLDTVCLEAAFVDLDQDGDLDLIVAQYAANAEGALAALKGEAKENGPGLAVFLNVGEAPAVKPTQDPPPLEPRFRRADGPAGLLGGPVHAVGVAIADFDGDRDVDGFVLADGARPSFIVNDRLLRLRRVEPAQALLPAGKYNGALVLDANHDGVADLFVVGAGAAPKLLLSRASIRDLGTRFEAGATNSPSLRQALAVDIDNDGWVDVVGLSAEGRPVLLHNDGKRLALAPEALGADADWPRDVVGVGAADLDDDGHVDLIVWSQSAGLQVRRSRGNGNAALRLELSGHRRVEPAGSIVRSNADGIGAWVAAQADAHWTAAEVATVSAGLGQSRQPLRLGLGRHKQADVVRLRWPDNCVQAELNVPTERVVRIEETNRKGESCPVLFAWNGSRFIFINDFLGESSVGEATLDGGHRKPRPVESVKIEAGQLAPRDGWYILKVAEPMNEVTYLDRLRLVVIDHPRDMQVHPDERFATAPPAATQDLLALGKPVPPRTARDHRGRDVLPKLLTRDRDTVDDFAHRTWIGFAEEHAVELDFGEQLAGFKADEPLILCLAGWTEYPYPESIWAANQAGVALAPPVLERRDAEGRWQVIAQPGFPAGLPRVITCDLTGKLGGERCALRLRTNMCIYWDQIFVAPLLERLPAGEVGRQTPRRFHAVGLDVHDANLATRGCMQEFSPDGRAPSIYDYDRIAPVLTVQPAGRLTRVGDVTELLRETDDCFVIFGPGDEVTARFDARKLPALPEGWVRSFVLQSAGFCKDGAPFTEHGGTVAPLPFRGMSNYPYPANEQYPPAHADYQRIYNTRESRK